MDPIYLDYNATTPLDPRVTAAMRPWLETHFGNPSSTHAYGRRAKEAVETARAQVADLLGATAGEIVFTSGGTEANNFAIRGLTAARKERGRHLITSAVEHPAVSIVCRHLAGLGWDVTVVPVDGTGRVDPADVVAALRPDTVLVTIMHANNEVGTIQPIREIADLVHPRGVLVHTDAAQSVGKIPVRVDDLGVDLLSVAGHKLYAPKGVGALYVRRGVALDSFMLGAGHEGGRRAGTENVAGIVGLGLACALAAEEGSARSAHLAGLRDRLQAGLTARLTQWCIHGHPEWRLPNTLSIGVAGVQAQALLGDLPEVAASPGAACHCEDVVISETLQAMCVPREFAAGTVRFSTGAFLTDGEIDRAVEAIIAAVGRRRKG